MRREVEEHRRRASEYLEEAGELRKERDALKLERNEMLINNARAVEEERAQKRALVGENDKLRYQLKCAEESLQASVIKCDKKQQELNTAQHEKNSYQTLLREKEIMNESLRRQTTELNEELTATTIEVTYRGYTMTTPIEVKVHESQEWEREGKGNWLTGHSIYTEEGERSWGVEVVPYLWLSSLDGELGIPGAGSTP